MAKDEQGAAETEGEGGNKKKFIIIGAAVAVAIILAAVVFMVMGKDGKKEAGKDEAKTAEGKATDAKAEGGHGAAAGAGGAAAGATNIYPLEPFIVNIYDGQELRYLKVKVELEMASPAIKPELDARLAPIRDAVLVLLSTKTLQEVQDVQGKNQLKEEILGAINKNIPPGKIAKVYFTDFVVQ